MKKRNEEVPDNLGGLGDQLPAEVLKMINELLEQLRQAGHTNQGSKFEFVYVAPGGQHVETQINLGAQQPLPNQIPSKARLPVAFPQKGRETRLPEVLPTDEAMGLWQTAQKAGYVDENYQPLISRTQAALLADMMAERLGIREKWKVFETLWNRKYMYRDYYQALGQRKTLAFQDELKKMFQ